MSDFTKMLDSFHKRYDNSIKLVCEGLRQIRPACVLDQGSDESARQSHGLFVCLSFGCGSSEFATAQYFLDDALRELVAVSALNPYRIERYHSYGDGTNSVCLYHDGNSLIEWIENTFMGPFKTEADSINRTNETWDKTPEAQKKIYAAYKLLSGFLLPEWKRDGHLQNLSLALAANTTQLPITMDDGTRLGLGAGVKDGATPQSPSVKKLERFDKQAMHYAARLLRSA